MRLRNLFICTAAMALSVSLAGASFAQQRPGAKPAGPEPNPRTVRFGVWDNSTNPNNVMTYEKFEADGSKLTVSNPSDHSKDWSYVTKFDGVFRPVQGQPGAETAVEIINPRSIRILNKRDGVVNQIVINTMSEDNNQIHNEYIRLDKDGKITGVTHVDYNRRK
jgi:hypothetical protein